MITSLPRKLQHQVTVQHLGAETLVYDESRHQAFCLNPTSAAVWNLADGTRTPAQIAAAASLSLKDLVTTELVEFALHQLRNDGLLEPAVTTLPAVAPVSRRAMLQSLGASSMLLLPAIAVIFAPHAAQAYGGCFDCSTSVGSSQNAATPRGKADALPSFNAYKVGEK